MLHLGAVLLLGIFLVSCKGNGKNKPANGYAGKDSSGAEVIYLDPSVDPDPAYVNQASKLIETIEYFPLESSSEVIIGKIDELIAFEGHIYLWDRTSQTVFIFTDKGSYVGKVDKQGKGPEEYIRAEAFSIDRNTGNILLYSATNWLIFVYNETGEFIKAIPADYFSSSFFPLKDDKILNYHWRLFNKNLFTSNDGEQGRLFTVGPNGDLISSALPYHYSEAYIEYIGGSDSFYSFGDSISLLERIGSTVYRIDSIGHAYPRFRFDFGAYTNKMSFDLEDEAIADVVKKYRKSGRKEWARLSNVFEIDDAIGVQYSYQGIRSLAFYSKTTGRLINIGPFWINDVDNVALPPGMLATTSDDKGFIGHLDAPAFIDMVKNNKRSTSNLVRNIAAKLKEIDNPVLVKYTLRDF